MQQLVVEPDLQDDTLIILEDIDNSILGLECFWNNNFLSWCKSNTENHPLYSLYIESTALIENAKKLIKTVPSLSSSKLISRFNKWQKEKFDHYLLCVEDFFLAASTDSDYAPKFYVAMLEMIPLVTVNPFNKKPEYWVLNKLDSTIAYSKSMGNLELLASAYFTKAVMLNMYDEKRSSIYVLRKISTCIQSPKLLIEYLSDKMLTVQYAPDFYKLLITGLYRALWIDLKLKQNDIWCLYQDYLKENNTLIARMLQDTLFYQLTDFSWLNLPQDSLIEVIKSYEKWLLDINNEGLLKPEWNPLQKIEKKAEQVRISSKKSPNLPVKKQKKPAPAVQNPVEIDYLKPTIMWLDKLTKAWINEHRKATEVKISNLEGKDLKFLLDSIERACVIIDTPKKPCPNVLPFIKPILDNFPINTETLAARLKLAKLYLHFNNHSDASIQYNLVRSNDPNNLDAHLGLMEIAKCQNKFSEVIRIYEKMKEIPNIDSVADSLMDDLLKKSNRVQREFNDRLEKISIVCNNTNLTLDKINRTIILCDAYLRDITKEADVYPYVLRERVTLKLLHLIKSNKFFDKFSDENPNLDFTKCLEIRNELYAVRSLLPNDYLTHINIGKINELYLNLKKVKNILIQSEEITLLQEEDVYKEVINDYLLALKSGPEWHDVRFEVGILHEHFNEFKKAQKHYKYIIHKAPENSLYAQRARLALAESYYKQENYSLAYNILNSMLQESETEGSCFNQVNDVHFICSKVKLYYVVGFLAGHVGYKQEKERLLKESIKLADQFLAYDYHEIKLIYTAPAKLDFVKNLEAAHPGIPALIKTSSEHILYMPKKGSSPERKIYLGDINNLLCKEGIFIYNGASLLMSGYYPFLFKFLGTKISSEDIKSWNEDIINEIAASLRKCDIKKDGFVDNLKSSLTQRNNMDISTLKQLIIACDEKLSDILPDDSDYGYILSARALFKISCLLKTNNVYSKVNGSDYLINIDEFIQIKQELMAFHVKFENDFHFNISLGLIDHLLGKIYQVRLESEYRDTPSLGEVVEGGLRELIKIKYQLAGQRFARAISDLNPKEHELKILSSFEHYDSSKSEDGKIYLVENPPQYFVKGMQSPEGIDQELINSFKAKEKTAEDKIFGAILKAGHIHTARLDLLWNLILMQEYLMDYTNAIDNCKLICTSVPHRSIHAHRARFKLAELYDKEEKYVNAYGLVKRIITEVETPGSDFNQSIEKAEVCSKSRLYYFAGKLALKTSQKAEAESLFQRAKQSDLVTFAYDMPGLKMLYVAEEPKSIDAFFAKEKGSYAKMPLLIKSREGHKLYLHGTGSNPGTMVELGDINYLLSENGIYIAPNTVMVLQGYYPLLYKFLASKIDVQVEAFSVREIIAKEFGDLVSIGRNSFYAQNQSASIMTVDAQVSCGYK